MANFQKFKKIKNQDDRRIDIVVETFNVSILRLSAFRKLTGLVSLYTPLLTQLWSRQAEPSLPPEGVPYFCGEGLFSLDPLDKHSMAEILIG